MREPDISADVVNAINEVRGQLRVVHELDASTTALVVIDMQNFFVEPGAALEVAAARDIVPNINRLASAMRDAGGTVAWIRMTFEPDELSTTWTAFLPVNGGSDGAATFRAIERDAPGHRLWEPLEVDERDLVVDKHRFSASSRVRPTCRSCSTNAASTRWSSSARSPTCAVSRRLVTR